MTVIELAAWDAVWQRWYDRGLQLGLTPNQSVHRANDEMTTRTRTTTREGAGMTTMAAHTRGVLGEVHAERDRQERKWGEQNHPNRFWAGRTNTTRDEFDLAQYQVQADMWKKINADRVKQRNNEGLSSDRNAAWDGILLEEVYEALAEDDPQRLRNELIQVAAVAVAWVQALDRRAERRAAS